MEVFKLGNAYLKNVDLKNVKFEMKIDDKETRQKKIFKILRCSCLIVPL